jgi:dihydroorotase
MQNYLIKNVQVVNEGTIRTADVLIRNGRIEKIVGGIQTGSNITEING